MKRFQSNEDISSLKKQLIEKELTDAEIQKEFSKLNDELAFKDHEIETLVHQQPPTTTSTTTIGTTKKESKKDNNNNNNNNNKDIHSNQEELQHSNTYNINKQQQKGSSTTTTRTKSPGKIDSKTIKLPSGGGSLAPATTSSATNHPNAITPITSTNPSPNSTSVAINPPKVRTI